MKKIININLSGRVIPIEDSAYEKLQAYIESLRKYFSNEEGREEIINDIESRLAELMNDKVRKGATCITDADLDEIIKSMGTPADFDADTDGTDSSKTYTSAENENKDKKKAGSTNKKRGKLHRDTSDKVVGGVCSGIASYLNTDPAIVRILFAIITFGGFGLGFLVYILLWIILPTADLEDYTGKRLFRNPDDKVVGGVAGGLGAYFKRETWLIRLIFVAPFILSTFFGLLGHHRWDFDFFPNIVFSSLGGTFIFIYIVLWMVLPEARNNYDKMEMRGETVDVNSIRQNVKEGMDNMKDRMKDWSEEVKVTANEFGKKASEFANTKGKAFGAEVGETARRGGTGIGHAIGVLFKVFFLFIAGTIAFGLFVGLIALVFSGFAWWPLTHYLWTSQWQWLLAWGTILFFLIVPLVGFIIWLVRRILGVKSRKSYLGWTFGFLWTVGWVSAILLAASLTKDFREYEHVDTPLTLTAASQQKMTVMVSQPELEYSGGFGWINDEMNGFDLGDDTAHLSTVKFNLQKSIDNEFHVRIKKYSFGKTEADALNRASKIHYDVMSVDSILDIGPGYSIDRASKFRGQQVEIEIQVPVGKKIRFDASVRNKLNPADFKLRGSFRNNRGQHIRYEEQRPFPFDSDIDYTMSSEGFLVDRDGKSFNTSSSLNYQATHHNDSTDLKNTLEEEKQKLEDSKRRIKELEEQQQQQKKRDSVKDESMDDADDDSAGLGNPGSSFSLVKLF